MDEQQTFSSDIAVIGMSGRFPGSPNVATFWQHIRDGVELITHFSDQQLEQGGVSAALRQHPNYVGAHGSLDGIDGFDAHFFGFLPREAEILDPQQRIFLECAWETLEAAGCNAEQFAGRIGVYAGASMSTYMLLLLANPALLEAMGSFQALIGNDKDYLATRVAYKLNLRGPAVSVQTACSTSLVAVHLACQALLNGECDMALAGGVSIGVQQQAGYLYQEGGIHSPDGYCRAFDASASGTVGGSGVGVVALKRLQDALDDGDPIHAVIKGFAINNDGAQKVGYTAPSVDGQAEVIRDALALAQVAAPTIQYIETHGTATPLGDPIEIAALTQVFREQTDATGSCAIGSVKTNIGHLDAAAGVAGLIKTVLALKHGQIPPSLHFERPNPQIDFAGSPFYVNTRLAAWPRGATPRRAGVSSFGIGGTNAHVVLEEALPVAPADAPTRRWQLLPLSARTKSALAAMRANLADELRRQREVELADVAFTLQLGRRAFEHRQILVAHTLDDALTELESPGSQRVLRGVTALTERPVIFMFPGQGAQYPGMAQGLYAAEPVFRAQLDRCAALFAPHLGLDLRAALYPELFDAQLGPDAAADLLHQTWLTQPALFAVEYALAQLWLSWGVRPSGMIGHSLGEYVAACLADVFSLEDAIALIAARGRLMHQAVGGMLSVSLSADQLQPLLHLAGNRQLALAAINGPALCVVAGSDAALDELARRLDDQGVSSRRLNSAYAFHSVQMDAIMDVFAERVRRVALRPPTIPLISNVTGTWAAADDLTDPQYWARQLRQTVRFAEGVAALIENPKHVLLEVGPGRTLISLARLQAAPGTPLIQSLRHPQEDQPDEAVLLSALGRLWLAGTSVDWSALYAQERRRRLVLPTYPFERQRYWLDLRASDAATPPTSAALPTAAAAAAASYDRPDLPNEFVAPRTELEQKIALVWQACLGLSSIGVHDNFFELGGHSLIATQLIFQLRAVFPVELELHSLFEMPTIAGLAELLEAKLIEKIASLSDEEIRLLI